MHLQRECVVCGACPPQCAFGVCAFMCCCGSRVIFRVVFFRVFFTWLCVCVLTLVWVQVEIKTKDGTVMGYVSLKLTPSSLSKIAKAAGVPARPDLSQHSQRCWSAVSDCRKSKEELLPTCSHSFPSEPLPSKCSVCHYHLASCT